MSLHRAIALFLMLVLFANPAMAGVCAIDCAGKDKTSIALADTAADPMAHCHETMDEAQGEPSSEPADGVHGTCAMAGCHSVQATSMWPAAPLALHDFSHVLPAVFVSNEPRLDIPPPIKPPA